MVALVGRCNNSNNKSLALQASPHSSPRLVPGSLLVEMRPMIWLLHSHPASVSKRMSPGSQRALGVDIRPMKRKIPSSPSPLVSVSSIRTLRIRLRSRHVSSKTIDGAGQRRLALLMPIMMMMVMTVSCSHLECRKEEAGVARTRRAILLSQRI